MGRPVSRELTDRELEVMHAYWRRGEMTATDARDDLAAGGIDLAYVTVANLTRILVEKGFLEATNDQRPFRYRPVRSFEEAAQEFCRRPGRARVRRLTGTTACQPLWAEEEAVVQRTNALGTSPQGAGELTGTPSVAMPRDASRIVGVLQRPLRDNRHVAIQGSCGATRRAIGRGNGGGFDLARRRGLAGRTMRSGNRGAASGRRDCRPCPVSAPPRRTSPTWVPLRWPWWSFSPTSWRAASWRPH